MLTPSIEPEPERETREAAVARHFSRRSLAAGLAALLALFLAPRGAEAAVPTIGKPRGRPRIKIDRLSFPSDVRFAEDYVRHLKFTLRREARRVDWGAGKGSTISFRFTVDELTLTERRGVLEVKCSAHGELPRGRRARSHLVYGGDPKKARELVRRVLEIVARGVVTRLSDLERSRRSA